MLPKPNAQKANTEQHSTDAHITRTLQPNKNERQDKT